MIDAAYHRRWRAANRERYLALRRQWRHDNLDRVREYQRAYLRRDRARHSASSRQWRHNNLDRVREYQRVYQRRVGTTLATRAWRLVNREQKREYQRRRYQMLKGGSLEAVFTKIDDRIGRLKHTRKGTPVNNDKMIHLIKRWRALESQRSKLDFERSQWCREVRDEFPKGSSGDKAFVNWLVVELNITGALGAELLERAVAGRTVPDSTTWDRVGGFSNIRALAPLAQRDKAAILKAAMAAAKTVKTVMRERGLVTPTVSTLPKIAKPDVVVLAEFISTLEEVPKDVLAIVRKYVARKMTRGTVPRKMAA